MSGYRKQADRPDTDRFVGGDLFGDEEELAGLSVLVGPSDYDGNPCVKIVDHYIDDDGDGAEWVIELRRYEVYALIRLLLHGLEA